MELGIPYELWDQPSAEVTKMHRAVSLAFDKSSCYLLVYPMGKCESYGIT